MRLVVLAALLGCGSGGAETAGSTPPPAIDASEYPSDDGECRLELVCFDPWATCPSAREVNPVTDLSLDGCFCTLPDGPYTAEGEAPCCYVVGRTQCPDTGDYSDTGYR